MTKYRIEHDCIGDVKIKSNVYYGANTYRARENFNITNYPMDKGFRDAIVEVKKACAIENEKLGLISKQKKKLYKKLVIVC